MQKSRTDLNNDIAPFSGRVERFIISPAGHVLAVGWIADEGCGPLAVTLEMADGRLAFEPSAIMRHARRDVEKEVRFGAYDYGFVAFSNFRPEDLHTGKSIKFRAYAASGALTADVLPERVSNKRLLDYLLELFPGFSAHAGQEVVLNAFVIGHGGSSVIDLFSRHVAASIDGFHVERFRPRAVSRTFITVLFGSVEPILLQPILFAKAGIDFGEWIYVCNSPEVAEQALRSGKLVSDLYDLTITVILMSDNVGFGAANNIAINLASSETILLVNPDVYPLAAYSDAVRRALEADDFGDDLWGGLLFYDTETLMHSGMFLEEDTFVRRNALNSNIEEKTMAVCKLLRVEHFDKGVPFDAQAWKQVKQVTAITGAMMGFKRKPFEKLGGFSMNYIYGHYEDADLSIRWKESGARVAVHPLLRLVHLEGQGSKADGQQYRGAAIANRHLFSHHHGPGFESYQASD